MFKFSTFRFALTCAILAANLNAWAIAPLPSVALKAMMPIVLSAGTPVSLYLNEEIQAENLTAGNALDFTVRANVTVNGKVLISSGSIASGWVKKVKKACDNKCSEITIEVQEVRAVDGQMVRLRSTPHIVRVPCCGSKENAEAAIGTNIRANVQDDITING